MRGYMMKIDDEIKDIFVSVESYKSFKNNYEIPVKNNLKTQIRILVGINSVTRGDFFQNSIDAITFENWKVGWARLFDQAVSDKGFIEWLAKIGMELYIISSEKKQREITFKLLNGLYLNILTKYIREIIGKYYLDKASLSQKSREIADETIYKVLTHFDSYNPYKSGLLTWMYTIARNTALTPGKKADENTYNVLDNDENEEENDTDKSSFLKSADDTPDEVYEKEELGKLILEMLFKEAGYPWQVFCVAFMKMDYKPSEIVEKFGQKLLNEVFRLLKDEFYASSFRTSEELDRLFSPLEKKLELPLKVVLSNRDSKTKKTLEDLLEKKCGNIKLEAFFSKNPNKNISDWNARSLIRLKKEAECRGLL